MNFFETENLAGLMCGLFVALILLDIDTLETRVGKSKKMLMLDKDRYSKVSDKRVGWNKCAFGMKLPIFAIKLPIFAIV